MKQVFFFIFNLIIAGSLSAQYIDNRTYSSEYVITLEASNISKAEKILTHYFTTNNIKIQWQEITQRQIEAKFDIPKDELDTIYAVVKKLGYVSYKNYSYTDNQIAINQLEADISRLKEKKNEYSDETIAEKQNRIEALKKNIDRIFVSITIMEENTINSKIAFVNMPGFEYGMLFTENPKVGLSAPQYQSYSIKYLFTRGKSYFLLSMLKAQDYPKTDSTLYNEYILLNFGQDFYTRHLGRGQRRFFNPYTSYHVGCFLANNTLSENQFIFNFNVAIGLEFIKTRNFLLDGKVSYFMPVNKDNMNLRGFQIGLSANLLF